MMKESTIGVLSRLGGLAVLAATLGSASCQSTSAQSVAKPDLSYLPAPVAARKLAKQPYAPAPTKREIYPSTEQAKSDVEAALKRAKAEHKRVLLDFGGNWCPDCQVLDIYFRQSPNADLLAKNFVKVNVNIGQEDANIDLAHKYGVPVQGVPALAVLEPSGKVVYAQNKEFSDMRYMEPTYVTEFLKKWKPGA